MGVALAVLAGWTHRNHRTMLGNKLLHLAVVTLNPWVDSQPKTSGPLVLGRDEDLSQLWLLMLLQAQMRTASY